LEKVNNPAIQRVYTFLNKVQVLRGFFILISFKKHGYLVFINEGRCIKMLMCFNSFCQMAQVATVEYVEVQMFKVH
jgi:hypothetical protein